MTEQPHPPNTDDIGARARTAVGWRALSQFSSQGISIVTGIILARLLMPADFGIIGMAGIVTGLAGVFQDLGFGQALVQRAQLRPEHSRAAFWMTLIMGGLLYAALYFGAPFAGEYFRDERMVPVLRLMALSFLISPFAVVPGSLLQRELDFRRPFWAGLAGTITSGAVGITLALLGHGYWSLVYALLASSVVGTIALCIVTRYTPPLIPTLSGARDLFAFGAGITGVHILSYFSTRVDYIIIGRALDAAALGLYTRAYNLIDYPVNMTSRTIYPILFPSFSRLQHDVPRLADAFRRATETVALIGFPGLAILAVTAPELIPLVFGAQWTEAVRPTQWMTIAGAMMVIGNPLGALVKAVGLIKLEVVLQAVRFALLAAAVAIGVRHGITGAAIGVSIVYLAVIVVNTIAFERYAGFGSREYGSGLAGPAVVASGVLLAGGGARALLTLSSWPVGPALSLAISLSCALVVALSLARMVTPGAWREAISVLQPTHKVSRASQGFSA